MIGDRVLMSGGWTNIGLSEQGEEQVSLLVGKLSLAAKPAVIYSSPLRRARESVEALAERLELPVCILEGLREVDCGKADGIPISQVRERFAREWEANQRQDNADFRWPGGAAGTQGIFQMVPGP